MKSVMLSIKPYWLFLIIAKTMGWKIDKEKTVEVRKSYPKNNDWNKIVNLYCTKDIKSFRQIPKEYQPQIARLLGKVIGAFVCDKIFPIWAGYIGKQGDDCLTYDERERYLGVKGGYGWHISDLKIYDKPKKLSEFRKPCIYGEESERPWFTCDKSGYAPDMHIDCFNTVTRPPQSWCYVEEVK